MKCAVFWGNKELKQEEDCFFIDLLVSDSCVGLKCWGECLDHYAMSASLPHTLEVKVKVTQLYLTLCIVHGILQARILERVAFPFSKGSSQFRDRIQVFRITGRFFTSWATWEAQEYWSWVAYPFSSRPSQPRNKTGISCITGRFFTNRAIREEPPRSWVQIQILAEEKGDAASSSFFPP